MAMKALANLSILQGAGDTSDQVNASTGGASAHLTAMLDLVDRWTSSLPSVNTMPAIDLARTSEAEASPLERCLAREAYKGKSVVSMVLEDLQLIRYFIYCKS